jgi:excisionase family DNA binding protein
MDDLFTTRQIQNILKVDRITIYRMLQDRRLKGIKVGAQWRFTRQEVDRLLGGETFDEDLPQAEINPGFPTHCVQTIQNLFSSVSQVSSMVVDAQGEPLTQVSNPCGFCRLMLQNPSGQEACRASWSRMAREAAAGSRFFTCHAGMQYAAAPFSDDGKTVGIFLAGEFHWQTPDAREEAERMRRLAEAHDLELEALRLEARAVPVIEPEKHAQVEGWPASAALAVQSILNERTRYQQRLQQIANLTQIP